MKITERLLKKWAVESVRQALKLGYDEKVLSDILNRLNLVVAPNFPPDEMWYGWAFPDKLEVQVFERNMSTENLAYVQEQLELKGVPSRIISPIISALRLMPSRLFFEMFNQAGMDHELIGHIYNFQIGAAWDEQAACDTQILLAKQRGGILSPEWKLMAMLSPVLMSYHKKDAFIQKK